MKTAVIAEKPSVAREIAAALGVSDKEDGFITGKGYIVTWAIGHLIGLAMPEEYGFAGFQRENLPIIPEEFKLIPRQVKDGKEYKPDPGALKQLKVIKHVFDNCDKIIVATDAGREGELIFRYIYEHLNCTKPFERLWISSLTDKAIQEGLRNLKPGRDYDNLYRSAAARSQADWLVGINASQALSISAGRGVYSLGRVQTPTLAMICKRYHENKNFVSVPFWQIKIQTEKADITFTALSKEKYEKKDTATEVLQLLQQNKSVLVKSVEKKEVNQEPPLLYDLTSLQKEGNSKHGFSADKTLSIAQKLYESKLISYPRTGSRYISQDVLEEIPELIASLKQYPRFADYAETLASATLNTRSVDDKKITDHHALIITGNMPKDDLPADEQTIYEMVAGRMLESFSKKCVKDATTIILSSDNVLFETKGSVIKQAGWRAVFGEQEENKENDEETAGNLPTVAEGEELPVLKSDLLEKKTKPKPLHTESSLLSAMESAGKEVEDEEERAAMKESGIGTPATRAAIIETLFDREYIKREKKTLVPTEKGLLVYDTVKDKKIADVAMTGNWENALAKIERGEAQPETFREAIKVYTRQITTELLDVKITVAEGNTCPCPKCKGKVILYTKVAKCNNPDCGLIVFYNKSDKQLSEKQVMDLLIKGKTGVIKNFKSKEGKAFDAALKFDSNFKVVFDFADNKGTAKKEKSKK